MKQTEYLRELKENLESQISPEELKDILSDYESFFVSGREDGKTDDEISQELGSPAFLAKSLLEDHIGKETIQQDKHITNPGRRLCAYLIDTIIAVLPTLILSLFIGTTMLPYLLFITYPSPVDGAMGYISYSAFTTYQVTGVSAIKENGEVVTNGGNVVRMEKAVDENLVNDKKPNPAISIMAILTLA
ncbi:MAG: HAAS signaling domain-containing protein, partial [Ruminiclostridium sp.]